MARSTYVYVVFLNGKLFSAFTVKHEMKTILQKYPNHVKTIWRCKDGWGCQYAADYAPVEMQFEDL